MSKVFKVAFNSEANTNLLKMHEQKTPVKDNNEHAEVTPPRFSNNDKTLKNLTYVSSAVALASLGVTTAFAIKNGKFSKMISKLSKNIDSTTETVAKLTEDTGGLSETVAALRKNTDNLGNKLERGLEGKNQQIKDLGKWQDGQIEDLRNKVSSSIQSIVQSRKSIGLEEIQVSPVDINGTTFNLASVLNGYGKHTWDLENSLRTESTKRIFGIVDRSKMTPPDELMVRVPTSEFKNFTSTGGMSVVPREVVANLGAFINSKQKVRLLVDTPMYLGQVEDNVYYSIVRQADGTFNYISSKSKKPLANLEKIDTMHAPIYTEHGKTTEAVEFYLARDVEQIVDLELLTPRLGKDLAQQINAAIVKGKPFEIKSGLLKVEYAPKKGIKKPTATIKYDAIFYKSDKFRLDGPVIDGNAKNIYNNLTHETGETERFFYFDKFFYEHLIRNAESSSEQLRADVIIGNDWQTGGISAMMKLLTMAKRYFGMDPKVAEKLYNTPVMTIMHNAGLTGEVWHSQPKLLNILFGEHSAMITRNAWMPKCASLDASSLNGLFHGTNLNPQTMAAAYSDVIIPVSKGYGHEMASHSGFGGANHDIFRMRARYHEYGDIEHVKYIARQNGLNPDLVPKENMGYRPITNGCDKVSNKLTEAAARKIEEAVGLEKGALRVPTDENIVEAHNHNKEVYLNKVKEETDMARTGKGNPMNIELADMTNLEGVTKETPVFSTAGRIVDQKGLEIYAESIEEVLERFQGQGELPVFYAQGVGDNVYIEQLLNVKRRIAQKYGQKAANRIVFARLFSEPGRYDGCKLMSDFTIMSSWFEPCGLVHKEIAAFSGAIPIVNRVGGLTDGLTDGVNAIFANFRPKFDNYYDALKHNRWEFANAIQRAIDLFSNKAEFNKVLKNSYMTDHSWLKQGGPMEEYVKILVDLKVLKPEVLNNAA